MTAMQERKEAGAETRRGPAKSARERVLETATELFYREGIRAVGIDRVIAESGVAKMSLYRNFVSKEDLVLAFLIESDRGYWERWDHTVAQHAGDPRRQIRELFAMLARRVRRPGYRGCPFINTATEFPDPQDRARAFCHAHKHQLSQRLRDLACAVGARDPELLADQLHLLIEGAYSSAQTLGAPRAGLEAAAEALVEAQLAKARPEGPRKKIKRG